MPNLIDYMNWRGDISFENAPFNEIDNMALERFSYFPLESFMEKDEVVTIEELANRFEKQNIDDLDILWPDDINLFPLMGKAKRFSNLYVTALEVVNNKEIEEQFGAVTIFLPDDVIYISYRGTDLSIIGWKEDFNLGFLSHIESQITAKNYLEKIAYQYPDKKIILGGHSKGGNVAIYAAAFCKDEIKDRIIQVYNNDGPGFNKEIAESKEYNSIIDKVHSYIPQNSIIGRVMNHKEKVTIVKSTGRGILQHDVYTWQLVGAKFVKMDKLTNESEFIDKTVTTLLNEVDTEKRKIVVDAIFDILFQTKKDSFKNFKENRVEISRNMLKSYQNMDEETKDIIIETVKIFFRIAKDNISELFK